MLGLPSKGAAFCGGVVAVLSPEGELLRAFGTLKDIEPLAREMEAAARSGALLEFYFTIDEPALDEESLRRLIQKLDDDDARVREEATRGAIKGLAKNKLSNL